MATYEPKFNSGKFDFGSDFKKNKIIKKPVFMTDLTKNTADPLPKFRADLPKIEKKADGIISKIFT